MQIEARKKGSKYEVYDHVLNLTYPFKKKADADELADTLNKKYSSPEQPTTEENVDTQN